MSQFASTLYPQTNPSNPILLEFRRSAPWNLSEDARREAEWLSPDNPRPIPSDATRTQVDHARRVLTRLASLSG